MFVLALLLGASLHTARLNSSRLWIEKRSTDHWGLNSKRAYWFVGAMVFTIGWVFLSAWHVYGQGNFRLAINAWWQWVAWFATFFLVFRLSQIAGTTRPFVVWMLALCFLISLHGCYQIFISFPADQERFRNDPQAVLADAGVDAFPGSSTYMLFEGRLQDTSPTGPFALTNSLAGFLLPWIVILFATLVEIVLPRESNSTDREVPSHRFDFVTSMVGVLMLWILMMTKSRTAWLALVVACSVYLLSHPRVATQLRRLLNPFVFTIGLCCFLAVGALYQWDRKVLLEAPQSLSYRLEYWGTTLRMVRDHLWYGVGPGNFQAHYATYKSLDASETVADPHQFLLETLGVAGLPALLGLIATIAVGFSISWQNMWLRFDREKLEQVSNRPGRLKSKLQIDDDGTLRVGGCSDEELVSNSKSVTIATLSVYWGGLAGLISVWFSLGALGPLPATTPYWLGIPALIAFFGLSWYRTKGDEAISAIGLSQQSNHQSLFASSRLKVCGVGSAVIAILVHLLASGGWMTPGVGNSLAVLVAIWLVGSVSAEESSDNETASMLKRSRLNKPLDSFSNWMAAMSAVAPIFLLLFFYYSTWIPTQRLKSIQNGLFNGSLQVTNQTTEALLASDPWDSFPSRFVADRAYRETREVLSRQRFNSVLSVDQSNFGSPDLKRVRGFALEFRAKDLADWQVWVQSGYWELEVAAYIPDSLSAALKYFQEASLRSPSDLGLLVQLALVAWIADEKVVAKDAWQQAALLEQQITHLDRKLQGARIYWPASIGPKSTRLSPKVWQKVREAASVGASKQPSWVRAEPIFEFLRTQLAGS